MTVQELNTLVGQNIRYYRKLKGWTVQELARNMGVAQESVYFHERGEIMPSAKCLTLYSLVFNIEAYELFKDKDREIRPITTGEKIRFYRKKAGLKQYELAEKAGISKSFVGVHENDIYEPTPERLRRYADVLGVEASQLTG